MLQEEHEELRKRYWGQHLWATGYFCRSVGTVTEDAIKEYIEQQREKVKRCLRLWTKGFSLNGGFQPQPIPCTFSAGVVEY